MCVTGHIAEGLTHGCDHLSANFLGDHRFQRPLEAKGRGETQDSAGLGHDISQLLSQSPVGGRGTEGENDRADLRDDAINLIDCGI